MTPAMPSWARGVDGQAGPQLADDLGEGGTAGAAVSALAGAFRRGGLDTPGLDARRLVEWALGVDTATLVREPERPITEEEQGKLLAAGRRRLAREPISRIVGERYFHGLALEIGPATLDPRPDTEILVDGVLELVDEGRVAGGAAPRILDLGTGSGAILIALLARLPEAQGLGVDISEAALAIARRNAGRHGVAGRAVFARSSWLDGVAGTFDLVVTNPPYIPHGDIGSLEPEVAAHDPMTALDGGESGLDAYRSIVADLSKVLAPGGWFVCEVGAGQAAAVGSLLASAGPTPVWLFPVPPWRDLAGIERCVAARARISAS